jgi:nicotinamidase-related amidase
MFSIDRLVYVQVDVQGRLAEVMHDRDALFDNLERLARGMRALEVPVVWMEQIPDKMGPTLPRLAAALEGLAPIAKTAFSCGGSEPFMAELERLGRPQVALAGIETHVCVYQTACDLQAAGYTVAVVADAVSSRTAANRALALDRLARLGIHVVSTEMLLFELLRTAGHPAFRDILKLVK